LHREEDRHADNRGQEQESPSKMLDHGRRSQSPAEIPYLEDAVDEQLRTVRASSNENVKIVPGWLAMSHRLKSGPC
jgi:hypothetical protein